MIKNTFVYVIVGSVADVIKDTHGGGSAFSGGTLDGTELGKTKCDTRRELGLRTLENSHGTGGPGGGSTTEKKGGSYTKNSRGSRTSDLQIIQ